VVGHKMSMLQDLERGRSLEIDALVTAVQELGQLTGVATPVIDAVLALVKERGRRAGLYAPIGGTEERDAVASRSTLESSVLDSDRLATVRPEQAPPH
jgi:hypothetical protein